MARGVCVIGVGGSGQNVLIALKERMIETYGHVPEGVVLLSLDTAAPEASMAISGVNLNVKGIQRVKAASAAGNEQPTIELVEQFLGREREVIERNRPSEFFPLITDDTLSVDDVLRDVIKGQSPHFADWIEVGSLNGLPQAMKNIAAGAGQRRPLGRVALFLNYPKVYSMIVDALDRLFKADVLQGDKYDLFVIGSVAGGTGSGTLLDVLNLSRMILRSKGRTQVSVTTFVVLPSAFQNQGDIRDKTNLKPNSYAALRELDRFQLTHASTRPTLIRYDTQTNTIEWVTRALSDYVYLVDTSTAGARGGQMALNPRYSVFPAIADFIASKITDARGPDGKPGGGGYAIVTMENNFDVVLQERWRRKQYLGVNTFTYIVPINDIVRSLSFRYLHEMHQRLFADPASEAQAVSLQYKAVDQVATLFSGIKVSTNNRNGATEERPIPALMHKVINTTREKDPERAFVDWNSLLQLLARTPDEYQKDREALQQGLDNIRTELLNTIEYRRINKYNESFEEGASRLIQTTENLTRRYLGPLLKTDDPQSRIGGDWDHRLRKYDLLRDMFAEALDIVMRDELNLRDEQGKLLVNRLPATRMLLENVRQRLQGLAAQLDQAMISTGAVERYRTLITSELKQAQADMEDAVHDPFVALLAEKPLKKQRAYIDVINEYLGLELAFRLFAQVKRLLEIFGALDTYEWKDDQGLAHKEYSMVARGLTSLDNWRTTLAETNEILEEARRRHNMGRRDKNKIEVRRYLTDETYEDKIYTSCLAALDTNLQAKGEDGTTLRLHWARKRKQENNEDEIPLLLELMTAWTRETGVGPVDLAIHFLQGAQEVVDPIVRRGVTIANRLSDLPDFKGEAEKLATMLEQAVDRPLLRHHEGGKLSIHRVLTFPYKGREDAGKFMQEVASRWNDRGGHRKVDARIALEPGESASALTTISFAGALALPDVQQFKESETDYRLKIRQGEPVHIFPEEQQAVKFEEQTQLVFPSQATQRTLSPEVVICMADKRKLEVFTAACAYEIIRRETVDPKAAIPYHEVFVFVPGKDGPDVRKQLSHSKLIEGVETGQQPTEGQLFLDALQQFCIVKTERVGMGNVVRFVTQAIEGELLRDKDTELRKEEQIHPFSLPLREVEIAIERARAKLGPSFTAEPDPKKRDQENARLCISKLAAFRIKADEWMKSSDIQVQDLGILTALVLAELEQALRIQAGDGHL